MAVISDHGSFTSHTCCDNGPRLIIFSVWDLAIISPWRTASAFISIYFYSPSPRIICAMSGYSWTSGSGEDIENAKVYQKMAR
jgi:hypothetical protein